MASQRSTRAIRQGRPIRQGNDPRARGGVRSDARVERYISIAPGENHAFDDWLVNATRNNPTMKSARNLGGLSLTLLESEVLRPALVKKYSGYGKYLGTTLQYQKEVEERFERFVAHKGWLEYDPNSALDGRLHFLGHGSGGQLGPLCVMVTDRRVMQQREEIITYLREEEGLDIVPPRDFKPHITIDNVRYKDMATLRAPQIPRVITLDPPTLTAYAGHSPR